MLGPAIPNAMYQLKDVIANLQPVTLNQVAIPPPMRNQQWITSNDIKLLGIECVHKKEVIIQLI
jgi:hypothetical protein